MDTDLSQAADETERLAIDLYEKDCMMLAIYKTGAESWPHDREAVRIKYRARALEQLTMINGSAWSRISNP